MSTKLYARIIHLHGLHTYNMNTCTHKYTHTHIYIYIHMYIYIYMRHFSAAAGVRARAHPGALKTSQKPSEAQAKDFRRRRAMACRSCSSAASRPRLLEGRQARSRSRLEVLAPIAKHPVKMRAGCEKGGVIRSKVVVVQKGKSSIFW